MTENNQPIKLLVADDHQIVRDGVIALLKQSDHYQVVGHCSNGLEVLMKLKSNPVDIVLMDINMPEMNGIQCTREITDKYPATRVLALTMHDEDIYLSKMLDAGASGYILKNSGRDELFKAIDNIIQGKMHFSLEITEQVIKDLSDTATENEDHPLKNIPLTDRELEILELIIQEFTNQEIAEKLFISIRTVDAHRRNLISKTGSRNTAGLVRFAIENRLFNS